MNSPLDLEKSLLTSETRSNRALLEQLLATDFFEFGASGKVWSREATIDSLVSSEHHPKECFDFKQTNITDSVALVTYKSKRPDDSIVLRSSTWRLEEDGWKLVFHQGTS